MRTNVTELNLKQWFISEASWFWCWRHQEQDSQQYWNLKHKFSELSDVNIDVENWIVTILACVTCHDFSMCYLKDVEKRDVRSLRWCWTIL